MKTAGPADASFLVRGAEAGAGRGESLKAGAVVSIEVRERIGSDLYRIAAGPRLFTASSTAFLEPGALLRARVERSGDNLLLRILDAAGPRSAAVRDAAATALIKAGLPADDAARAALTALLGAGISPDGAALGRVRRAALRAQAIRALAEGSEDEAGLVELAARMEAKGLVADEAALEAVATAGDGRSGRGDGGSGKDREDRGAGPQGRPVPDETDPTAAFDLERDFERSIPEQDLAPFLGAFLKALVARTGQPSGDAVESPEAGSDVKGEYLGLFNHVKGRGGGWLLVPFRFALDSVDFAGNFRIQLPYVPGGPGRIEARFDASGSGAPRTWRASFSFGGGARAVVRVEAPSGEESPRFRSFFAAFEAEMAASGCAAAFERKLGRAGAGTDGGFDLDA